MEQRTPFKAGVPLITAAVSPIIVAGHSGPGLTIELAIEGDADHSIVSIS